MDLVNFKLENFEGPLDLLLTLISKHKLDVRDIEISKLLEQYVNFISELEKNNIDISVEFLDMLARLIYIKTVSLMPKLKCDENPKAELESELMDYKLFKFLSSRLKEIYDDGFYEKTGEEKIFDYVYDKSHDIHTIYERYELFLKNLALKSEVSDNRPYEIVTSRNVSIESKVFYILRKIYVNTSVKYNDLFDIEDRCSKIATFVAFLELIKNKRISIKEDNILYINPKRIIKDKHNGV